MLTRIGDFINPSQGKGETGDKVVERPDQREREKGGQKKDEQPEQNDDTYFSIDAIRALLQQENVPLGPDVLACFALLKERDVTSIPIRNEQSIIDAITDAAARLK